MGDWTKVLLLAACLASTSALKCNVGSAITNQYGDIQSQQGEQMDCNGMCVTRSVAIMDGQTLHVFACEDKHVIKDRDSHICTEELCNVIQNMKPFSKAFEITNPKDLKCYVGIKTGNFLTGGELVCDGECANVTTIVSSKNTTAYFCAPFTLCSAVLNNTNTQDSYSGCKDIEGGKLHACCCYDHDNCNAVEIPINTPEPYTKNPIVCYDGIHLMNQLFSGGQYVACKGECAAITYMYAGLIDVTLYTCDPASICKSFRLDNDCMKIDSGTLSGCCCDSDACIDPTLNPPRYPNGTQPLLKCYVGVHINKNFTVGNEMYCDGECGRVISTINGYEVEGFFCAPKSLCRNLDMEGSCTGVPFGTMNVTGCCCTDSNNCNTHGTDIDPVPTGSPKKDVPIACYEGISVNGYSISQKYVVCAGDCASLTIAGSVAGSAYNATLYTCDPASVCRGLGVVENCATIDGGIVSGCCCSTDACIDPIFNKYPNGTAVDNLRCFVGVRIGDNITIGNSMPCDGMCGSVNSRINGVDTTGFFCAPKTLCEGFGMTNDCVVPPIDKAVQGCCCNYKNNCNAHHHNVIVPPYKPPTAPPIVCYAGLAINDWIFSDPDQYMPCKGDCASVSFKTSMSGVSFIASLFTCDPVSVCKSFNMNNTCGSIPGNELTGCCCDFDDCIDVTNCSIKPRPGPPVIPSQNLTCFVGVHIGKNFTVGSEMYCDGECGRVSTTLNGMNVEGFFCSPKSLCRLFNVEWTCGVIPHDQLNISACCCSDSNNCNARGTDVAPVPTTKPKKYVPIICYEGISINNQTMSGRYISCQGDCASITLASQIGGLPYDTTLYTCDPASVCRGLGIVENCAKIDGGVISGCCCSDNACIDPVHNKYPTGPASADLMCFVGVRIGSNITIGNSMICNGMCGSVNTRINGVNTTGFYCAPKRLCEGFGMTNDCVSPNIAENVQACCCNYEDNCNAHHHHVVVPPYTPPTAPPIACFAGLALNSIVTQQDQYMSCRGDCAQVTFNTQFNGENVAATLFTCDPVSVCSKLGMNNTCAAVQGGVLHGCCCNFDDCIDVTKRTIKPFPTYPSNLELSTITKFAFGPQFVLSFFVAVFSLFVL